MRHGQLVRTALSLFILISFSGTAAGQAADSVDIAEGSRAYWKHMKALQKSRFTEFTEWQQSFLNVPSGRYSVMLSVGYGLPVINQRVEAPYPYLGSGMLDLNADGTLKQTGIYTSDGKGFRTMIRQRYMFNPFAGMELGIGIEWYDEVPNGRVTSPGYKSNITSQSYAVTLTPQLVMSSPNLRNFYVYGRIGAYMPIWGGSRSSVSVDDRNGTLIRAFLDADLQTIIDFGELLIDYEDILAAVGYKATLEADVKVDFYKNPTVIGFQTAVGFRYQFSREWGVVMEYFHGGYAPFLKKSVVQDFHLAVELFGSEILILDENGGAIHLLPGTSVEITPDILGSTLNVNYYRSLDEESNNALLNPDGFDPTRPTDELTDKRLTYSHGFFVGIQYNLPSRGERGKKR